MRNNKYGMLNSLLLVAMAAPTDMGGAEAVDPFAVNTEDTDTSMPLLAAGLADLVISEAEVADAKKNPGSQTLRLVLKTTADGMSTKGEPLSAGFPLFHYISITPSESYPATRIAKAVAMVCQAAGVTGVTVRQVLDDPSMLVDKVVRCKVGIRKETDDFPESNTIKTFVPLS